MKFLPGIGVSKLSGTLGGITAQNWRGLGVFRRKPIPGKTLTARQMFINSLMSLLSTAWRDDLNQGQRTSWNQRAKNYPWVDVFGNERKMTGLNLYIKQNMVLLDHGLPRHDNVVADVNPPELLDVTVGPEVASLNVKFPVVDAGLITSQAPFIDIRVAGGFLLVEASGLPDELSISTQGLPAGRIEQKSDFRHCFYADRADIIAAPDGTEVITSSPIPGTRNLVMSVQQFNKFGNFSAPLLFSGIKTSPV